MLVTVLISILSVVSLGGEATVSASKADPEGNYNMLSLLDVCASKVLIIEADKQAIIASFPEVFKDKTKGVPWSSVKQYVQDIKDKKIKIDPKLVDKISTQVMPCFLYNAAKGLIQ